MAASLSNLCRRAGFDLAKGKVTVWLSDVRRHVVRLEEVDDTTIRAWAVVARRRNLEHADSLDLDLDLWRRNRGTRLVGFHIDRHERVIGTAWIPRQGLDAEEFAVYVNEVAKQSDRLEFLLTGRDVE